MFNREPIPNLNEKKRNYLVSTIVATTAALALAGCTTNQEATAGHTSLQSIPSRELVPNMSGFLKPGSTTTCLNGGARPCAIVFRTQPELSADNINAAPNLRVSWPVESYGSQSGDSLSVRCFIMGQLIHPYEGTSSSKIWYEVAVPEKRIVNPTVLAEFQHAGSSITTIPVNGTSRLAGYASIEWFGQSSPLPDLPRC